MRPSSLRDIDFLGHDVRVWCVRCARGSVVPGAIWEGFLARGWAIDLGAAAARFRCLTCGDADSVMVLPARRKPVPLKRWADEVAGFFHANRSAAKKLRRVR